MEYNEEKYSSLYSTDDFTAIQGLTPVVIEILGDVGNTGVLVTRNYDLSAFAGEKLCLLFLDILIVETMIT